MNDKTLKKILIITILVGTSILFSGCSAASPAPVKNAELSRIVTQNTNDFNKPIPNRDSCKNTSNNMSFSSLIYDLDRKRKKMKIDTSIFFELIDSISIGDLSFA